MSIYKMETKLFLTNFKCFKTGELKLPSSGSVLFSAESGAGKSTIFDAIKFVLWNEGKSSEIITYGKRSCEVVFIFKGYIFKRKRVPNYFEIKKDGILITDPENFIDNHFKRIAPDFIELSAQKQLQILESLDYNNNANNTSSDDIKDMFKEKLSEIKAYINGLKSKLEGLYIANKNLIKPNFEFTEPLKPQNSEQFLKNKLNSLIEENSKINHTNQQNMRLKSQIQTLEAEIKRLDQYKNYDLSKEELNELSAKINLIKYSNKRLEYLGNYTNFNIDEAKNKISKLNEDINNQNKINSLKKKLNLSYDLTEQINHIKQNLTDYQCPNCHCSLALKNNKLEKGYKHDELKRLYDLKVIYDELQTYHDYNYNVDNLQKEKKLLESMVENYPEYISLQKNIEPLHPLEYKLSRMQDSLSKRNEYKRYNEQIVSLQNKIIEQNIIPLDEDINLLRKELQDVEKYNKWLLNEDIKNSYLNVTNEITSVENLLQKSTVAFNKVEQLIKAVEFCQSECIKNIICHFNAKIQFYCQKFFKDNFKVVFEEFKNVGKIQKPQINMVIYNQGETVKLNNLSSGEYARVKLAVDMALNDLSNDVNTPLMLDEVTANLDGELSSAIYNVINSCSKNNVYVIAHQTVEGVFDHHIDANILNSCFTRN